MNTQEFFSRLDDLAVRNRPAIASRECTWTYAELLSQVQDRADLLQQQSVRVIASYLDNGADWILNDLATLYAGVVHVPLPLFFNAEQITGVLDATAADAVICSHGSAAGWQKLGFEHATDCSAQTALYRRPIGTVPMPAGTAKITFTSGSTGSPKGVCLSAQGMLSVGQSLANATHPLRIERHLNILPLAVLLENIAGVYAPLLAGATCIVPPLREVGFSGSSQFDPAALHASIQEHVANSAIVLPQILKGYATFLAHQGKRSPESLRLLAVGGAAVSANTLESARALGLPAFEGYGLSEGTSVQTLNLPGASRSSSVGRPLPHAQIRISDDGEIEIAGSLFLGYLGLPSPVPSWFPTGDLGYLDNDGYLHIHGRKKNLLITAFGRNVSPEWVETMLCDQLPIAQAVVLGEAQPRLGAVIWPSNAEIDDAALQLAIDRVNDRLPDYAQITAWERAKASFSSESGLATANGRPRRDAIVSMHPDLFAHHQAGNSTTKSSS